MSDLKTKSMWIAHIHWCRKGLDPGWLFGSGEAGVSVNEVITE